MFPVSAVVFLTSVPVPKILTPRVGTRGVGSVVFAIRFAQLTLSGSTFLRSVVAPCISHAGQRWLPELALAGW